LSALISIQWGCTTLYFEQTQGLLLELQSAEVRDKVFASKGLLPISKKSRKEIKYQQSLGYMTAEQ